MKIPRAWKNALVLERARAAFVEVRGVEAIAQREAAIANLETRDWRGQRLFALTCEGPFGNGPHVQYVPEYVLWSLINLGHWLCPFHR